MLWEYFELVFGPGQRFLKLVGYALGTAVAGHVMGLSPNVPLELALPAATIAVMLAVLSSPEPIAASTTRAALLGLGVLYGAGLFPFLAQLRDHESAGLALATMGLFCTWAADTGAYFSGKALGRHKLYPLISPKKTVEGLVGGIVAAIAAAFLVRWLFAPTLLPLHTAVLGAIAGAVGTIGDLSASMIKRSVGAKDSSAIIPGHGGVLDRFDGVMFVVPVFHLYVVLLAPWGLFLAAST
jgi:phosphatidate cytidylyltransferase